MDGVREIVVLGLHYLIELRTYICIVVVPVFS